MALGDPNFEKLSENKDPQIRPNRISLNPESSQRPETPKGTVNLPQDNSIMPRKRYDASQTPTQLPKGAAEIETRRSVDSSARQSGAFRTATQPPKSVLDNETGNDVALKKDRKHSQIPKTAPHEEARSLLPAYALFTCTVLLLAVWLIGPKLVEEYNFAATRGKVRAEYENAIGLLESRPLENVSKAFQLVADKIRPSVVSINAKRGSNQNLNGTSASGYGSGVIMSKEGHIVTNAHVLEGAVVCWVVLHDRSQYRAKLVGIDWVSDLAVLKIDASSLIPATWGDSESAEVGSIVWAIGSPYRYEQTVTSGIISGKDRPGDRARKQSLLQTDAAVNPGNSGGPLVDANGNVIGINTSIYGETFQGISFAVPSATAEFVYGQLIKNGSVIRGYLGVSPQEVDYEMAAGGLLPDLDGAVLTDVFRGSPADLAGIQRGDVIRQWNGQPVKRYNSIFQLAERSPPNSTVEVVLLRNGKSIVKQVVVGELPNMTLDRPIRRPR